MLALAIVFGLGAMLLSRQMLAQDPGKKDEETQEVVVAARDLKEEESLKPELIKVVRMAKSAIPPGAFSSPKDVEERWFKIGDFPPVQEGDHDGTHQQPEDKTRPQVGTARGGLGARHVRLGGNGEEERGQATEKDHPGREALSPPWRGGVAQQIGVRGGEQRWHAVMIHCPGSVRQGQSQR